MNKTIIALTAALLLVPLAAICAADAPVLVEPAEGAVLTENIPHFQWQRSLDARTETMPAYDNESTDFPGPSILLRDTQNATVRDNRVTPGRGAKSSDSIVLQNTDTVRLENNSAKAPRP